MIGRIPNHLWAAIHGGPTCPRIARLAKASIRATRGPRSGVRSRWGSRLKRADAPTQQNGAAHPNSGPPQPRIFRPSAYFFTGLKNVAPNGGTRRETEFSRLFHGIGSEWRVPRFTTPDPP